MNIFLVHMVLTRKMDPLIKIFDDKFEEFKNSLLDKLKAEIATFSESQNEEILLHLENKKKEISVSLSDEYTASLTAIQNHVTSLQSSNAEFVSTYDKLTKP